MYTPSDWDPALAERSAELPNARLILDFVYGYQGAPLHFIGRPAGRPAELMESASTRPELMESFSSHPELMGPVSSHPELMSESVSSYYP